MTNETCVDGILLSNEQMSDPFALHLSQRYMKTMVAYKFVMLRDSVERIYLLDWNCRPWKLYLRFQSIESQKDRRFFVRFNRLRLTLFVCFINLISWSSVSNAWKKINILTILFFRIKGSIFTKKKENLTDLRWIAMYSS